MDSSRNPTNGTAATGAGAGGGDDRRGAERHAALSSASDDRTGKTLDVAVLARIEANRQAALKRRLQREAERMEDEFPLAEVDPAELAAASDAAAAQAAADAAEAAAAAGQPAKRGGSLVPATAEEVAESTRAALGVATILKPLSESGEGDLKALPPSATCRECGTVQCNRRTFAEFGVFVCFECRKRLPALYESVTKSKAMKEYLLSDFDLSDLRFVEKPNARGGGFRPMKLYLRLHLQTTAEAKWGSMDDLAAEKKRREVARLLGPTAGAGTSGKKKKKKRRTDLKARGEAAKTTQRRIAIAEAMGLSGLTDADVDDRGKSAKRARVATKAPARKHEHNYGEPIPVEGEDGLYVKKCGSCGLSVEFESF